MVTNRRAAGMLFIHDDVPRHRGLTSLMSLTGVIGPLVSNQLFAEFTGAKAPVQVPGIAFFLGAALMLVAMVLAARLFGRLERLAPVPEAA